MHAAPLPCPSCGGAAFLWISPAMERGRHDEPVPRRLHLVRPSFHTPLTAELELFLCRGCGRAQWRAFVEGAADAADALRPVPLDSPQLVSARCLGCGSGPHLECVIYEHDEIGAWAPSAITLVPGGSAGEVLCRACRACGRLRWFAPLHGALDPSLAGGARAIGPGEELPCGCPPGEAGALHLREILDRGPGRAAAALAQRRWHGTRWLGAFEGILCRRCDELVWYVREPGALAGEPGVQMIEASPRPATAGPYR